MRIWKRLYKHCDELFTFLDDPQVPADNNGTERDIRSLAAARNDGGTHRADWSAAAFARIKSVIVTGMKNGVRFIEIWDRGSPVPSSGAAIAASLGRGTGHQLTVTGPASDSARPRGARGAVPILCGLLDPPFHHQPGCG